MTDVVKDSEFVVFKGAIENGGTVRGINAKGQGGMARKKIDKLVDYAKDYGAKGLAYIAIHEDGPCHVILGIGSGTSTPRTSLNSIARNLSLTSMTSSTSTKDSSISICVNSG